MISSFVYIVDQKQKALFSTILVLFNHVLLLASVTRWSTEKSCVVFATAIVRNFFNRWAIYRQIECSCPPINILLSVEIIRIVGSYIQRSPKVLLNGTFPSIRISVKYIQCSSDVYLIFGMIHHRFYIFTV